MQQDVIVKPEVHDPLLHKFKDVYINDDMQPGLPAADLMNNLSPESILSISSRSPLMSGI
jgi:hypothetical protein